MRSGRPRTPTLLKLVKGTDQAHTRREEIPVTGTPGPLPWLELNATERRVFDWLVARCAVATFHGEHDSYLFTRLARLIVQQQIAEDKVREYGAVMKHPRSGKPEVQPYARVARDLGEQIRLLMGELGITPIGRLKFAAPKSDGPTNWDDIV